MKRNEAARRRAWRAVLLLAAGAVINVAIAWGFGLFPSHHEKRSQAVTTLLRIDPPRATDRDLDDLRNAGVTLPERLKSPAFYATQFEVATVGFEVREVHLHRDWIQSGPGRWTTDMEPFAVRIQSGVPMRSMRDWLIKDNVGPVHIVGTRKSIHGVTIQRGQRHLPLWPIWPGFAINTFFYAALMWGFGSLVGALARRCRLRRGQCGKCGYPIGVSEVCTECGASVKVTPGG